MSKTRIAATLLVVAGFVALGAPDQSLAASSLPTCMNRTVTIMGTDGPDRLIGQSGVSDVIYGGLGNDQINGGDFYEEDDVPGRAPDYNCGGPGADYIVGGPGNDHINGGDGNDTLWGQRGDDVVRGNAGADHLRDLSCADCDSGDDVQVGGPGPDDIFGGYGVDRLEGNGGADSVIDLECDGPTTLLGGGGDDYLESWSSSFEGWHGNVCAVYFGDSASHDRVNGGLGEDTAQVDTVDSVLAVEHLTRITEPPA